MTAVDQMYGEAEARRGAAWLAFAATMLIVSGGFKILDALWAFKYDDDISEEVQTIVFENDLASWGWVWLGLGALLIAAGFGVLRGGQWSRWFGIAAAGFAAIVYYPWIFVQPIWTLLGEGLLISVIYGLVTYGGRLNESR